MTHDPEDRDLHELFGALKADDELDVPELPAGSPPPRPRPSLRVRSGALAAGLAGLVVAGLMVVVVAITGNGRDSGAGAAAAIAFDELDDLVSRELFAASAVEWEAPTDFLLDTNLYNLNQPNQ